MSGYDILIASEVARELGMITYRSTTEFNQRFSWSATSPFDARALSFDVERLGQHARYLSHLLHRYLDNKSVQFANHFDPNCFLLLSKCMCFAAVQPVV